MGGRGSGDRRPTRPERVGRQKPTKQFFPRGKNIYKYVFSIGAIDISEFIDRQPNDEKAINRLKDVWNIVILRNIRNVNIYGFVRNMQTGNIIAEVGERYED